MLYFLHTLQQTLHPHIIRTASSAAILNFRGMLLLEQPEDYQPDYLCLAPPDIAVKLLKRHRSGCLITAGDCNKLARIPCPEELTLIVTDLSLIALSNRLNQMIHQIDSLHSQLCRTSPYLTRNLVKAASAMSDSSFAILDDSMAFLYDTIKQEDSDFYAALIRDAHRFHEIICQMFGTSRVPTEPLLSCTSERLVLFLPFRRNHCCLLCTAAPDNPDACSTALILRDLCDPLLSTRIKPASSKNMSFQLLFSRLMSENGDSDETLLMMLHNLAIPSKKHMRLILIRSELSPEGDESISLDHLLRPVSVLFSGANIAVMPAEIVVLLSSDTMYCPLPVSIPEFEQMLEENRALAMIGNPFTTVMAMRVTCRQCQRIFPIAMAVKLADEGRCMTFARYTQYNVIDICARSINAILGGSDIVILTHPGVVALTRYDRANGTNLRDVMFYYLMNDRSIAKTSAQLFMHRNTTIYKIKKIEELIGESMDDPYLRHNLIFSCLLLRYREQYQKEEVSLSQFERPKRRRRTSGAEPKLQG